MANSSLIDAALVAKLVTDPALTALCPDGVWWENGREGATKFVVISLVDEEDEPIFGGRGFESALYLVKAVHRGTNRQQALDAADRIDALLEDQPLTAAGYTWMTTHREGRFETVEVDGIDASIRYLHCGGHYRIDMSVGT